MVLKSNFTKTKQKQTKQPEAYDLTTRPTTIEQRRHQRDLQLSNNVETTRLRPFYFIEYHTQKTKKKDNYFDRCKIFTSYLR